MDVIDQKLYYKLKVYKNTMVLWPENDLKKCHGEGWNLLLFKCNFFNDF